MIIVIISDEDMLYYNTSKKYSWNFIMRKKMLLIWYIIKAFTFVVKYTYLLVSVSELESKSGSDSFHDERFL